MKVESAGIAFFGSEILGIVFKERIRILASGVHLAGIRRRVFAHNVVDYRMVGIEAVETGLQICCAVVGCGAVPDGIVEYELGLGKFRLERIDYALEIVLVGIRAHGSAFGPFLGTVVGTEHYRKVERSLLLGKFRSRRHSCIVGAAPRQKAERGNAAYTAVFHPRGHTGALVKLLAGNDRRSLGGRTGKRSTISDAVAYEHHMNFVGCHRGSAASKHAQQQNATKNKLFHMRIF